MAPNGDLATRFRTDRATWNALVANVPAGRMDEPGPMGEWTFKDTVSHLAGWRSRTVRRVEAAVRGEPRPGDAWPSDMTDSDPINDWIRSQGAKRSVVDLLAEYDASFERMAVGVSALPATANPVESDTSGYFRWNDASGPLESDFFNHLAGHVDDVEAWLAKG